MDKCKKGAGGGGQGAGAGGGAMPVGSATVAALKAYYDKMDGDADGKVSSDELASSIFDVLDRNKDGSIEWRGTTDPPPLMKKFDKEMDEDSNGKVDKKEFTKALLGRLDKDGDGSISKKEYMSIFAALGKSKALSLAASADARLLQTGGSGRLRRHRRRGGKGGCPELAKFWRELDADSDGEVSEEEFVSSVFDVLDADSSGALSVWEYMSGVVAPLALRSSERRSPGAPDPSLKWLRHHVQNATAGPSFASAASEGTAAKTSAAKAIKADKKAQSAALGATQAYEKAKEAMLRAVKARIEEEAD